MPGTQVSVAGLASRAEPELCAGHEVQDVSSPGKPVSKQEAQRTPPVTRAHTGMAGTPAPGPGPSLAAAAHQLCDPPTLCLPVSHVGMEAMLRGAAGALRPCGGNTRSRPVTVASRLSHHDPQWNTARAARALRAL